VPSPDRRQVAELIRISARRGKMSQISGAGWGEILLVGGLDAASG